MKKRFYRFVAVLSFCCFAGCASVAPNAKTNTPAASRIRTGFFVDHGSRGGGVLNVARLLYHSPQIDVTLLDGKDIRDGKLDALDMLVIPGGSSATQFKMMQSEGAARVREFVRKGGSYVGVCAGFHCTLNRPDRIALLPFVYINSSSGLKGKLVIEISGKGAKILDVAPGRYDVTYSQGPISRAGAAVDGAAAEVLGVYKNSVGRPGRKHFDFTGSPSILFGHHGKGKVAATSFHPEDNVDTYCIFNGMVYAVTGKKIVQKFPVKNYRPVRVAFYVGRAGGKERILRMLELDRHPELDLRVAGDVGNGILDHSDVFITIAPDSKEFRAFVRKNKLFFDNFMNRGGRIIAVGSSADAFGKHPNLVKHPAGKSFVEAALARP